MFLPPPPPLPPPFPPPRTVRPGHVSYFGCLQPLAQVKRGPSCKAYTIGQEHTSFVSWCDLLMHRLKLNAHHACTHACHLWVGNHSGSLHPNTHGCYSVLVTEQAVSVCCHTDGDIYGSEGQYIRYEEATWDSPEAYEDVSSGQPYAKPGGRSGSARPFHSHGSDRFSDDNMADGDAYVTPETTAPLQAAGQVSTTPPLPSPFPSHPHTLHPPPPFTLETAAPLQAPGRTPYALLL